MLLAGPISHTSTYTVHGFVEIFIVLPDLSSIYFIYYVSLTSLTNARVVLYLKSRPSADNITIMFILRA